MALVLRYNKFDNVLKSSYALAVIEGKEIKKIFMIEKFLGWITQK